MKINDSTNEQGRKIIAKPIKVTKPEIPPQSMPVCSFGLGKSEKFFIKTIIKNDEQKIKINKIKIPKIGISAKTPEIAPKIRDIIAKFLIYVI